MCLRTETQMHFTAESTYSQDIEERAACVFRMVNRSYSSDSGAAPEKPHKCGLSCLGPLTFHRVAVGSEVVLSEGGRLAQRTAQTFKNGLVFSSRPVKVRERLRLRVERDVFVWHGALRVGFTTVPPSRRRLPLPSLAVPDLTHRPGHWAGPVHESCCTAGSELEFWVSSGGTVYARGRDGVQHQVQTGVDLSKELWAMVDVYGQTCSVLLLGSEKRELLYTRRSCPAPARPTSPYPQILPALRPRASRSYSEESTSFDDAEDEEPSTDEQCVVCMERTATFTLPCGHRCLCQSCDLKVIHVFNKCPLCRHKIAALPL